MADPLISQNVAGLPRNERIVLSLYYLEGMTLKEIAALLQVSESRVSQIRAKGIERLKRAPKEPV